MTWKLKLELGTHVYQMTPSLCLAILLYYIVLHGYIKSIRKNIYYIFILFQQQES